MASALGPGHRKAVLSVLYLYVLCAVIASVSSRRIHAQGRILEVSVRPLSGPPHHGVHENDIHNHHQRSDHHPNHHQHKQHHHGVQTLDIPAESPSSAVDSPPKILDESVRTDEDTVHTRHKRAVTDLLLGPISVNESSPNRVLTSLANVPAIPDSLGRRYVLNSTVPASAFDMLVVNTAGTVSLKNGVDLDFETMPTIRILIHGTKTTNQSDVYAITVTVNVQNINEPAVFVTEPKPYLATVTQTAGTGVTIISLIAVDPDQGASARMRYTRVSVSPQLYTSRFDLEMVSFTHEKYGQTKECRVVTRGTSDFSPDGEEISITISAQDEQDTDPTKSTPVTVKVLIGIRPPQFFTTSYVGAISENSRVQQMVSTDASGVVSLQVKVKKFQVPGVAYSLLDETGAVSTFFTIDTDGYIRSLRTFDYDTLAQKMQELTVVAAQTVGTTQLISNATVTINILDSNDNNPIFDSSQYQATIAENAPINSTVQRVKATDKDAGDNGRLDYFLKDTTDFYIETVPDVTGYMGVIRVKNPLDFDTSAKGVYSFKVQAVDRGATKLTSEASVRIYTTNVNDEAPRFAITPGQTFPVLESATVGRVVTQVLAVDPDGDAVKYYFSPKNTTNFKFRIDTATGLITLNQAITDADDRFQLNITAEDDGSCCNTPGVVLSNTTYIIVQITDINTHKPTFEQCNSYSTITVREGAAVGTPVVTVSAVDGDRGPNGQVTYSITSVPTGKFRISPNNGTITVDSDIDRETTKFIQVTVKGTDGGDPVKLEGLCSFRVTIDDINDNRPKFDSTAYVANITRDLQIQQSFIVLRATDEDVGQNAEVAYSFLNDASGTFGVAPESGYVFLKKALAQDVNMYNLTAMAQDKGIPPLNSTVTVTVNIKIGSSRPPVWDQEYNNKPYDVAENVVDGYVVISGMSCNSSIEVPRVEFQLVKDGTGTQRTEFFSLRSAGTNRVDVLATGRFDYEQAQEHIVRIRCLNYGQVTLFTEVQPIVRLQDKNNKIPYFVGTNEYNRFDASVAENQTEMQVVITITGRDDDMTSPFNVLTFRITDEFQGVNNPDFEVVPMQGNQVMLKTKRVLDRESKPFYFIDIMAIDGAESVLPGVAPGRNNATVSVGIKVTDINDNPPFFNQTSYSINVDEEYYLNTPIMPAITALDLDESDVGRLQYLIVGGNNRNTFGVRDGTGALFLLRRVDYESGDRMFVLTLQAFDGQYSATTTVTVKVNDVNDNLPVINPQQGNVDNIVEEDDRWTPSNPLSLLNMTATDADVDRQNQMMFSLRGYGTGDTAVGPTFFQINSNNGQLFLIGKLDRDTKTGGRASYVFTVVVADEPVEANYGFAEVTVRPLDINDNDPSFVSSKLEGTVLEKSNIDTSVVLIQAEDPDFGPNGTVTFSINRIYSDLGEKANYFKIDQTTGLIRTNVTGDMLDREADPTYYAVVKLTDSGPSARSTTGTVTIRLGDINDNIPVFGQRIYRETMSENLIAQEQVTLVIATDRDEMPKLYYSVSDTTFFKVETINNQGSIQVYKQVDYENENQRFFNLTVTVRDEDIAHTATCNVEITVLDFNDNVPLIVPKDTSVTKREDVAPGTVLTTFTATDADSGFNAQFEFSIDRNSDRRRFFFINATTGEVRTRRKLDRETARQHVLIILAIDKGSPPLTGTATLTVNLDDINDNYPTFLQNYQPHVQENLPASVGRNVQTVLGYDPDGPPFGAPFGFAEPRCTDGSTSCPCSAKPSCQEFKFRADRTGAGGNGSAIITTDISFDREKQKYYLVPIVMWDMYGTNDNRSQTGTNTLTVTIADVNDNNQSPGHQDVFVYNYKGQFGPLAIGRVYVNDLDDWDLPDKTFTFVGPQWISAYFSIEKDSGNIIMKKGVPSNTANKPYNFEVDVYDKREDKTVRSTVSVVVNDLSEQAVMSSGAVRLTGTSAAEFIKKPAVGDSKFTAFRKLMASKLNVPVDNVEIISVMDDGEFTDVRYSAHGSPYYQSSQTDGIVVTDKKEFEALGLDIVMVPIDACAEEEFEGGCYNYMNITGKPAMVNSNGTSFVGVEVFIQAEEGCRALVYPGTAECTGDFCYNGGTCIKDDFGVLTCQCLDGFDGNRCQQLRHSFDGNGYAMYPTLEQCEDGQTSIEFITTQDNGLILYNGPLANLEPDQPRDFIALELVGGYPVLHIDHGSGHLTLSINGRDSANNPVISKLSDGQWHRIDILRAGRSVELIVDSCQNAVTTGRPTPDTTPCRAAGVTPGVNSFLNVATLLQLGGRSFSPSYQPNIGAASFNGCVRNLRHNSKLYDLYYKSLPNKPSGQNGCPREDDICGTKCGVNGVCSANLQTRTATCVCKPKWRGDTCNSATTVRDLKDQSYFQWTLSPGTGFSLSQYQFDIQVMFRTRDKDGYLFTVRTASTTRSTTLEISGGRLQFIYDFGDGINTLALTRAQVSNGQWHVARVRRVLQQVTLTLDEGEGRNYNFSRGNPNGVAGISFSSTVYSGGVVSTPGVVDQDLTSTCMQDIRINNVWFPMKQSENSITTGVDLTEARNVADDCIRNPVCVPACMPPKDLCYPLWDMAECRCNQGYHASGSSCVSNCLPENPCMHNSPCDIKNGSVVCVCPDLWYGPLCQYYRDEADEEALAAGLTGGAIAAIVVSIIVVLLIVLLAFIIIAYIRKRQSDREKMVVADEDDFDIRENVMFYDEEGAGEEDQRAYDLAKLPAVASETNYRPEVVPRRSVRPVGKSVPDNTGEVGNVLGKRLRDAEDDPDAPPFDMLHDFNDEGAGSTAGSLSSLNTTSSDASQDYDYLNEWGPKFAKLADMYGAGADEQDDM